MTLLTGYKVLINLEMAKMRSNVINTTIVIIYCTGVFYIKTKRLN